MDNALPSSACPGHPEPACFGLATELGRWGRCCFAHVCFWPGRRPVCPEEGLHVCAAVHCGRQKREAGLQLTISDTLRGNTSYFLWIALSFISLQINLVTVGDSTASTAEFFSVVSLVHVFLLCSCNILLLVLVLSSINSTCCGVETTGPEDSQGPVSLQLGLSK